MMAAPGCTRFRASSFLKVLGLSDRLDHPEGDQRCGCEPLASHSWMPLAVTLPSQWYGFSLVERAVRRGPLVIVARPARLWMAAVPELGQQPERVFTLRSTQNPAISSKNLGSEAGYDAVFAALTG